MFDIENWLRAFRDQWFPLTQRKPLSLIFYLFVSLVERAYPTIISIPVLMGLIFISKKHNLFSQYFQNHS